MIAMVLTPESRTSGIHRFRLEDRHRNAIRRLKIRLPTPMVMDEP